MIPKDEYRNIADKCSAEIADLKKRIAFFSWGRLVLFLLTALGVWLLTDQWNIAFGAGIVGLTGFLLMVRRHAELRSTKDRSERVKRYADFEIAFLNGEVKGYDRGSEFIDPAHPFASDLDVFGASSVFEFINRTKSFRGKQILADDLRNCETNAERILEQREHISEFGDKPEFIFNYLAGAEIARNELESEATLKTTRYIEPYPEWAIIILTIVLPIAMISLTVFFIFGVLTWSLYSQLLLLSAIPVLLGLKKNMSDFRNCEGRLKTAAAYGDSLALLRDHTAQSKSLRELFSKADLAESERALAALKKINGAVDSRNNIFVGIALNLLLLWDFQCHRRLSAWQGQWAGKFEGWIDLAHRMEAVFSYSIYVHNHPQFNYPEMSTDREFVLEEANHIQLHAKGVANDFSISGQREFVIVTGANMAGKSTYLRTVGTNLLLAMKGLPVPVKRMRFFPSRIFTSMVTADNLGEGESYFFSELKRLRELTDILEEGKPLFVILDEILKGTNSVDKAEGSRLFMEKLLDLPAKGLIATHDLSLCKMQNDHPEAIVNYSFEVEFKNDDLIFDYKLRNGVCQNMNARFLLERMGLTKTSEPAGE